MAFEKTSSAGYLANHMARLFADGLRARIKPLGIVPGQFPALLELWENEGLTQKELVARLDIEQATMANTLSRMERDGLIRRKPHPGDGRAQLVWLTAKARALRAPAVEAAIAQNEVALALLSVDERRQFLGFMQRTVRAMQDDVSGAE
jgi:DNA-binding MarR family transcriptional regulator